MFFFCVQGLEYEKRDTILDDTLFGFFSEEVCFSVVLSVCSSIFFWHDSCIVSSGLLEHQVVGKLKHII
jgi:hypothetical protein